MKMPKTRKSVKISKAIFVPKALPPNKLPTIKDVLQLYLLKEKNVKYVALQVQSIWLKVLIPIMKLKSSTFESIEK